MKRLPVLVALAVLLMVMVVPTAQADHDDPEHRVMGLLDTAAGSTGTQGVYLRQIDGATVAANNENFVFEPASTIKALIHFHAMKQVEDNPAVDLTTQIPWFAGPANYSNSPPPGTSCPDNSTLAGSETLSISAQQMMGPSDNRRTQAQRDFFTDGAIDATRAAFGMTSSGLDPQHIIGCGALAVSDPNRLTLVDAGLMYEDVFTGGFLADPATAAGLMTQDNGTFNTVIDQEAVGMGLDTASIAQFKTLRQSANKAGSYGLSTGQYRSVAGWSTVPWKDADCEIVVEDYVYGAFIHAANSITANFSIRATGVELFREEINAALQSWVACEADLEITSSTVLNPPAEMDVNGPTALTVRVSMRNNGPAASIDGVLDITPDVPADCTVTPSNDSIDVLGMAEGNLVVEDVIFTVECANPSSHQFTFDSDLQPADEDVVDPDPFNNDGTANATIAVIARADLAVVSWDFSELDNAGLGDLLVGTDFLFATPKTVDNFGDTVGGLYDDPVDATVTRSIEVPAGVRGIVTIDAGEAPATVIVQRPLQPDEVHANQAAGSAIEADGPATIVVEFAVDALAIDEARGLTEQFGVACLDPGEHDIVFVNAIEAVDEHVIDPDETNNSVEVQRTIDCVTPVQINVRPGNAQNQVNTNGNQKLPVAILTTEAGEYGVPSAFDATTVDYTTVSFGTVDTLNGGGGTSAEPDKNFIRDSHEVTDEKLDKADDDMVLHFRVPGSGIDGSTTEACVYGSYEDGGNTYHFFGCDMVAPN